MLRLVALLTAFLIASGARADVVYPSAAGPTLVFFAKYGPFWRARERGVIGVRACRPDVARSLPRPAKVPVGSDLGSQHVNDVFWYAYDRWMEKVEPGCVAKPAQYFDAASFRGMLVEGGNTADLAVEVRAWNTVAPIFRGADDPLQVLMGIVADRYQLLDLNDPSVGHLRAAFAAIADGTLPSLAAPNDGGVGENRPLPDELAVDPTPVPVTRGSGKPGRLKVSWGGAPSELMIGDDLRLIKLSDGLALAPLGGSFVPVDRDQERILAQAVAADIPVDTYDLTRAQYKERDRDAWMLADFRKVYAALSDQSRVFIFRQKDDEVYVLAGPGQELQHVITDARYPITETLIKRVGGQHVFRGPRAAAELLRLHEESKKKS